MICPHKLVSRVSQSKNKRRAGAGWSYYVLMVNAEYAEIQNAGGRGRAPVCAHLLPCRSGRVSNARQHPGDVRTVPQRCSSSSLCYCYGSTTATAAGGAGRGGVRARWRVEAAQ